MHLVSVALRGFKSFADRTTLTFEPGLVGIVGPNGAGKSNLIDALIWCLGTLSTRALRAEAMADVIFVGTELRKGLGMAQVVITLDNADATFPLDFSEVQIGRTLYRDGASEYSINGTACRLLDVSELLAEAGIGRELHAVVAQGHVDDIVQSKPEELRSYVEEAAGISKHRRRKERALRKIEQVELDIARVADVASELRRQLRPLRSQAEQARRHVEITERLREIRIRRLVGELVSLERDRARAMAAREGSSEELSTLRDRLVELRNRRLQDDRRLDHARGASVALRRSLEHLRSAQASTLRAVIAMRERAHARPDVRRRDAVIAKLRDLDAQETEARAALATVSAAEARADQELAALGDRRTQLHAQTTAEAERLLQIRTELTTIEAETKAAEQAEITARAEGHAASERVERARSEIARLNDHSDAVRREIEELDSTEGRASLTVERIDTERRVAASAVAEAESKLRALDAEHAVLEGRCESLRVALELGARRREGAEAVRRDHGGELDARGVLADLIHIPPGLERAVEAALGPALDALVVAGARVADTVERAEAQTSDVLVAPTLTQARGSPELPGARPLAQAIEAPPWLRGTIDALLEDVYVVGRWDDARSLCAAHPDATFVTAEGRVLRSRGLSRSAATSEQAAPSVRAALERAEHNLLRVTSEARRWATNRDRHGAEVARLEAELAEARSGLGELEGRIAAAADRLRELGAQERGASLERDLAEGNRDERLRVAEIAAHSRRDLGERATRLREDDERVAGGSTEGERELQRIAAELREIEARRTEALTTRASLTERVRGIAGTRDELETERADAEQGPADPEDLRAAEGALAALDAFVSGAETRVQELLDAESTVEAELRGSSEETSRVEVQVASLEPRSLHASEEVARLDVRIEEIGTRLAHDHDIPPSRARAEFGPAGEDEALDVEERRLDRELKRMGPVNPLAAQEITSLDRRREFLESQLEDLRSSKRDLMKVVRAADEQMRELLVRATEDANAKFQEVIELLFPEGGGRLRLSGSDDPLEAGVEIEVRLGRKGHRRLGFLSGGEKALAGLGFLFALHLARPTPFIVLDEVDAPLDDANLGRFLRLIDSLRLQTQVIVITHQKRTMEQADTLVGVTLNPDGTSRVVTQRLSEREREPQPVS